MPDPSTSDPNDQAPRQQYNEPALRRRRPPIHVAPLEYYRLDPAQKSRMPVALQFMLGFFMVLAFGATAGAYAASTRGDATSLWILVPLTLAICGMVRWKLRWRGFIPGVLVGILLPPLLLFGAIVVICGVK